MTKVSPLAPTEFPKIEPVKGIRLAAGQAGIKYQNRPDVMLAVCDPGSVVAGVFTSSLTRSAAVLDCQSKLGHQSDQGVVIVVNSSNANAFTGAFGQTSVDAICTAAGNICGVNQEHVFTSSTGVIGEVLDHSKIIDVLDDLYVSAKEDAFEIAARSICTTDTFPKAASRTVKIGDSKITISGIAKGSGMIAPDMATMLVYIFTDATISQKELQSMVGELNAETFNCITVDGDTSTSDTLLCVASGASNVDASDSQTFKETLHDVMLDLSHQVVRDGEGASKFIEVEVTGAATKDEAHKVGMAIANSPLVKTAIAGEDPNWGRIVMAVGKSGARANRDGLKIKFGDILVAENGWVSKSYSEELGANYMKNSEISISVDLSVGSENAKVWTCDFTHDYITINADYRS